jgi:hypothetical protein
MEAQNVLWQVSTSSGKTFSNISDLTLSGDTLIMKNDSNSRGVITDSITDVKRYSETTFYTCLKTGAYIGCGVGVVVGIITVLNSSPSHFWSYSKSEDRLFVKIFGSAGLGLILGSAGGLIGGLLGSVYYLIFPNHITEDVHDLARYDHFKKIEIIRSLLITN